MLLKNYENLLSGSENLKKIQNFRFFLVFKKSTFSTHDTFQNYLT